MLYGKLHVIKRDGDMGSEYPITENIVIGSHNSVNIRLNANNVSERQCQIVPEAATRTLHLEVLDAVHVTAIDGQRLNSGDRKKLENGDIVLVGDRRFKIMYPKSNHDKMKRTPARAGAVSNPQSAQKRRKSIFDSTPPVPTKTPTTPQKNVNIDLSSSTPAASTSSVPRTPQREALPRTSPRQPKGILSAKKNILVTRTPTMSPKVVRWGSPKYKSPTSPSTLKPSKQARKSTPALLPRSPVVAVRKRSFGTLDEKIKKLAALPARRRSSASASVRRDSSIVDEVPETPDTSRVASDDLSGAPESPKGKLGTPKSGVSSRRSSTASSGSEKQGPTRTSSGSSVSRKSEPAKSSPDTTPNIPKRVSTTSNVSTASSSSSSSRKSRFSQNFRVSPITTPSHIGVKRLSTKSSRVSSNRSSLSSTSSRKSRQSFRASPSLSNADVFSSTIAASPDILNGSAQPADSFGSLSVSEADLSMFDGTLMNDRNENSTLKGRRLSGTSSKQRSRVSRSPKAESLMEVDEVEASEEPTEHVSDVPKETPCDDVGNEPGVVSSRRSSRLSNASAASKGDAASENEVPPVTASSSNQENKEPPKKTWAGVLKRSIASGSPFKVNQRKSLKLKSSVKTSVAKALKKNNLQRTMEAEIVAAFATTGHALSPQTIFINKRLNAATQPTKTTPKRNSSLLNKTHDIELEMFVSPFNTPDNSEALERARDFVKRLPSSRKSTSEGSSSLFTSAVASPQQVHSRRSTRNSGTTDTVVEEQIEAEEPSVEGHSATDGDADDETEGTEVTEEAEVSPAVAGSSRKSMRRSSGANLLGVKKLLATPKGAQSPENNLDCDLRGLKKMLATPKVTRSPENDLERDIKGVKKIFATPKEAASPKNELDGSFGGVKKLLRTPKEVPSPKNELDGNFSGVKKLLRTPKEVVSPKNELDGNFSGVKKLLATPKEAVSPKNELDGNFSGMKKMLRTPKDVKSPENNLDCDYRGTKRLFKTPESPHKREGRGLNDSALEGVQELLKSTTPKRKPASPVESRAKRARKSTSKNSEHTEIVSENGNVAEIVEGEVNTRTPIARGHAKRGEKIEREKTELESKQVEPESESEAVEPEQESEPAETTRTRRTEMTKTSTKSERVTPARGRTTRRKATKNEQTAEKGDEVQEIDANSSETAPESQNSADELAIEGVDTKTRATRRKKVEFAELPEAKTPTVRRGRRAKSTPVKTAAGSDAHTSGAESQPSETESQASEAESQQSESKPSARGSRMRGRRQVEEKVPQDDEPESANVKKSSTRTGRSRRNAEKEASHEEEASQDEEHHVAEREKPVKSSGRGRKPKAAEVVTGEAEGSAKTTARGRSKGVTKKNTGATRMAKEQKDEQEEHVKAPSEDQESAADPEPETPAKKPRGGRKATSKSVRDDTAAKAEKAKPASKRTRVGNTAKNKKPEPEEPEPALESEPEAAPEPEPKKIGRKRKVQPSVSPAKKAQTKKRARKAAPEAPASTASTRTTRARRR